MIANGQITLTWKKPAKNGGSTITSYIVQYRATSSAEWVRATQETVSSTSYTVMGLSTDDLYEFRVAAVNSVGMGPYSDSSMPVQAKVAVSE